jgi:hypothetical protein
MDEPNKITSFTMSSPKPKFSSQEIFTYTAIIVSGLALVVSVMQTYYQQKHLYSSAWPHIQVSPDREEQADSTKNKTTLTISNKGVGPAIIESISYEFQGKKFERIDALVPVIIGNNFTGSFRTLRPDDVLAQNESIIHFSIIGAKNSRILNAAFTKIKLKIVYRSIYDERWEFMADAELEGYTKTTKLN